MFKELPSPELLRKLLRYDPETGKLFWRERPSNKTGWNTRHAGREAFNSKSNQGYLVGGLLGRQYKAHRIAYAIMEGRWPDDYIDHINGDPSDNRWSNLRPATNFQNQCNVGIHPLNTSGLKNVSYSKSKKKWYSRLSVNGRRIHIGLFDTKEEAFMAYLKASDVYLGEYARLPTPL